MRVTIRVRPGSSRAQIGGNYGGALVVTVQERAAQGVATAAALAVLAKALGVPQREVLLVSGASSRTKIVEVPDTAGSRVADLLQGPPLAADG